MFYIFFLGINVLSFVLFGIDKFKAIHHQYRIAEKVLLGSCVIGGCFGGYIGMKVFHHKTLHTTFQIIVPLSCFLWIGVIGYAIYQSI